MINLIKVISSELDSFSRRVVKFLRLGLSDTRTSLEAAPYGIDSNPVKDMIAIYLQTGVKGKDVVVGYINKNQVAEIGESRIYSTDSSGTLKFSIHLKNDGTCEVGGSSHNLVRYTPLNDGLQDFVTFVNQQLGLIATGIAAGGGSYTPGSASIDISDSKIDEIKTL